MSECVWSFYGIDAYRVKLSLTEDFLTFSGGRKMEHWAKMALFQTQIRLYTRAYWQLGGEPYINKVAYLVHEF